MKNSGQSFARRVTTAGLVLLALALAVVVLNLVIGGNIPEGLRGVWAVLRIFMALVLLASWVLLNVPQPKPPSGDFVLAVAQFGELQPNGTGWVIAPGQRSFWDQLRATIPASIPLPGTAAFERLREQG